MVKTPPKKQVFTILEFASRSPWPKFERGAFFIVLFSIYAYCVIVVKWLKYSFNSLVKTNENWNSSP